MVCARSYSLTLSNPPAYIRNMGNDIWSKIRDSDSESYPVCRLPGAQIRIFHPDFKVTSEGTFGGPGMSWVI